MESNRYQPVPMEEVKLGALSCNFEGIEGSGAPKFYLTTAIAYTNGYPHIGHAYEFLSSDVIVRYHRVLGHDTFFLTGSDEHGQKVEASAEKAGRTPLEHCNVYVAAFKALNQRLAISNSDYLRTTDPRHILTAQKLWNMCAESGDIYLDAYEGWYNEREETFVTDTEAEQCNFQDPSSGVPLKRVKEESYFFRMSKYTERLMAHIEENPSFIEPEQYKNNILGRLKKEGLKDLSLSRTSFSWGIPMPEGFDSKHVMYVWFDALSNYLTGVNALNKDDKLSSYWPADKHIIGKDIIWFHCVIWPCMLMSAGLPLPGGVFSHGFVNGPDGRKMSKSFGNVVDPLDMLDKYSADTLRYVCVSSVTYGLDLSFSEDDLVTKHNSELADIIGNLVHRALNLCQKYCDGIIPDCLHDPAFEMPFDLANLIQGIALDVSSCSINLAVFKAMEAARATNKFLTDAEPWKMKGSDEARRKSVVRTTLEAIYAFMHFLAPVIPLAAEELFLKLGTPPVPSSTLRCDFYNLSPGTRIFVGDVMFKKIEASPKEAVAASDSDPGSAKSASISVNKASKKGGKGEEKIQEDPNQPIFTKLELKVGRIVNVKHHETAERLFCEDIDIGEGSMRPVASGLRQYYTLEQMQNRLVIVVCNLTEAKMQGFVSCGMVLAAKSADGSRVELVNPPASARIGERVFVEGLEGQPLPPSRIKKLKVWESVAPDLSTNEHRIACFQNQPLLTSAGPCSVDTLVNSPIS